MKRTPRLLIPALVLSSLTGCLLGGTGNPSYFPHYLPPGDIVPTHAKPPGTGYFANFDPKAVKLAVTPAQAQNAVGTKQVLIATVSDADGQPRRKRRVEWILDGPGYIIEVDESGYSAGRGYVTGNNRAISYTGYFEHNFDRGNSQDDFCIKAGQTWCVVSSAVPGETTVTAYAPEIRDASQQTVITRLSWGGDPPQPRGKIGLTPRGGTGDPPLGSPVPQPAAPAKPVGVPKPTLNLTLETVAPKAAPLGQEATFTIELANAGETPAVAAPITLAATVPAGSEFVRSAPAPTRQAGDKLTWVTDAPPAGQPKKVQVVLRPQRNGPLTLKATADAENLHAAGDATVTVGTPKLVLKASLPPDVPPGGKATLTLTVENSGATAAEHAVAYVRLPAGVRHQSGESVVEVAVGTVAPGPAKRVEVPLTVEQAGEHRVKVNLTADGDLSAQAETGTRSERASATLNVTGPAEVAVGDTATWQIVVKNTGDKPLLDMPLRAGLPPELTGAKASDGGTVNADNVVSWRVLALEPGKSQTLRLTARGDKPLSGDRVRAGYAPYNGKLLAEADAPVRVVGHSALEMEWAELPATVGRGRSTAKLTVRNSGTAAATEVEVAVAVEAGLAVRGGTGPRGSAGRADGTRLTFPVLAELAPGKSASFAVELAAEGSPPAAGQSRVTATVAATGLSKPLRDEQAVRVAGE